MRPGTWLLSRYLAGPSLADLGELRRQAATDTHDGVPVEILSPQASVLLRPDGAARFREAHGPQAGGEGRLGVLALGTEADRPFSIRRPLGRPWTAELRVDATDGLSLLIGLGARVLEAGPALQGLVEPVDLGLDPDGRPILAPSGLRRAEDRIRPSRYAAPESGGDPAGRALYGLGVVAFEALTGPPPVEGASAEKLRLQQATPRRLRELLPEAPAELDALISTLLGFDGAARIAAIRALPLVEPLPILALSRTKAASASVALVLGASGRPGLAGIPSPAPSAQLDINLPDLALVADVIDQPGALRRRLAALADLDPALLDEAARRGLPIVLKGSRQAAELLSLKATLEVAGIPLRVVSRRGGTLAPALGAGVAACLLTLPVAIFLLGLGTLLSVFLTMILGVLIGGAGLLAGLLSARRVDTELRDALRLRAPASRETAATLSLRSELQALRRATLERQLPEPIRLDLLGAADEIDQQLDDGAAPERALMEAVAALRDTVEPGSQDAAGAQPRSADLAADLHRRAALVRSSLRS